MGSEGRLGANESWRNSQLRGVCSLVDPRCLRFDMENDYRWVEMQLFSSLLGLSQIDRETLQE